MKVLSEAVTAEETSILKQNVQSGTATRSAIDCPTAAKTGTTSELVDAWLDGYTPNYSTVVWMGYPNKRVSMTDVHGEPQQGGYLPAEIWHAYMAAVTEGKPCVQFPPSKEPISYTALLRQIRDHRRRRARPKRTVEEAASADAQAPATARSADARRQRAGAGAVRRHPKPTPERTAPAAGATRRQRTGGAPATCIEPRPFARRTLVV